MPVVRARNGLEYLEFRIKFFKVKWNRPDTVLRYFVYGWYRDGIYLYIGMTTRGRGRFAQHHVLSNHRLRTTDRAHVWYCKDGYEAETLENRLINEYEPFLNKRKKKRRFTTEAFVRKDRIFVPKVKKIIDPGKTIEKPKIITVPQNSDILGKPSDNFMLNSIKGASRLQALGACKNKKDYNFVMQLIKRGLI